MASWGAANLQHYTEGHSDPVHSQFPFKRLPQWAAAEEPVVMSPVGHWLTHSFIQSFIPQLLVQKTLLSAFSVPVLGLACKFSGRQERQPVPASRKSIVQSSTSNNLPGMC